MNDRKLHLVYSSTPSETAEVERADWGLKNARQLQLFEDYDKIRVAIVPIVEISSHSFRKAIQELDPVLIIDTRVFPDFFSIFSSTDEALSEFQSKGIEYRRVSLEPDGSEVDRWGNLDSFKRVLGEYFERRVGAPVLLLTSTLKKSARLAEKIPGYLSQEVAETQLEEVPR